MVEKSPVPAKCGGKNWVGVEETTGLLVIARENMHNTHCAEFSVGIRSPKP